MNCVGADCSCFPWIKRAVGPAFFIGDGIMMLLAIGAGVWARASNGISPCRSDSRRRRSLRAGLFWLRLYPPYRHKGPGGHRRGGWPVHLSSAKEKFSSISSTPSVSIVWKPAGKLAALNWSGTRFIGVPTENPQFGDRFMGKSGLTGKGPVSKDLAVLRRPSRSTYPRPALPSRTATRKPCCLQFEDKEPLNTLKKIGFAN